MNIENILEKMCQTIKFSKKVKFKTILLENIALHEAQIDLNELLKNSTIDEKKEMYNYAEHFLNDMVREGTLFEVTKTRNNRGFIIQPSLDTNMKEFHQYTLLILDEVDDIIA